MLKKIEKLLSSLVEKYHKPQVERSLSSSTRTIDAWKEATKIIKEIDAIEGVIRAKKHGEDITVEDDDIKINGWSIKELWQVEGEIQSVAREAIINAMECYVSELRRRLEAL